LVSSNYFDEASKLQLELTAWMFFHAEVTIVAPENCRLPPFPSNARNCPRELLLESSKGIMRAMSAIEKWCPSSGLQAARVPPLLYQSMARSGKTTFLWELFHEMKRRDKFAPIYITLNGGFSPYPDETPTQSIVRLIGLQLAGLDASVEGVVVDENEVMNVLEKSSKPVVLLVDELNYFGNPVEKRLATFLKAEFLDKRGRYLVATTHVPMSGELGGSNDSILSGTSGRGYEVAMTPVCLDISEITTTFEECGVLKGDDISRQKVSYFSGMMGLMFSNYTDYKAETVFRDRLKGFTVVDERKEVAGFLRAMFTGNGEAARPEFARFGTNQNIWIAGDGDASPRFRWPIVYIFEILRQYPVARRANTGRLVEKFVSSLSLPGTGLWFENLITFAVLLRCLQASVDPTEFGPFDIAEEYRRLGGSDVITKFTTISARTVADADMELLSQLSKSSAPMFIVGKPSFAGFPTVDLLLYFRYYVDGKEVIRKICFQIEEGKKNPKRAVPTQFSEGYLIKGLPASKPRGSRSTRTNGGVPWEHVSEESVARLLGCSLRHMLPKYWDSLKANKAQTKNGQLSALIILHLLCFILLVQPSCIREVERRIQRTVRFVAKCRRVALHLQIMEWQLALGHARVILSDVHIRIEKQQYGIRHFRILCLIVSANAVILVPQCNTSCSITLLSHFLRRLGWETQIRANQ
jgi:hypothetical protein